MNDDMRTRSNEFFVNKQRIKVGPPIIPKIIAIRYGYTNTNIINKPSIPNKNFLLKRNTNQYPTSLKNS